MPRPSRHHALTPKSSAAPLAPRPGQDQHRVPRHPAADGDEGGAEREHDQPAAHADRAPDRASVEPVSMARSCAEEAGDGAGRASWTAGLSTRQLLARREPPQRRPRAGPRRRRPPRRAGRQQDGDGGQAQGHRATRRESEVGSGVRRGRRGARPPGRPSSDQSPWRRRRCGRRTRRAWCAGCPRPSSRRPAPAPLPTTIQSSTTQLRAEQPVTADDEGGGGEQRPGLEQPREVERARGRARRGAR